MLYILPIFASFFDALFTKYAIINNIAQEANPIMEYVIHSYGWVGFFIVKQLLTTLGIWALYVTRNKSPVVTNLGLIFINTTYIILIFYHLIGLIQS